MEQFVVSARKYRPASFDDVVGQTAITSTLENAIANNKLAQALLFTGPRGVGKTTCARILAKRINQGTAADSDEDFAFNIFELDAASNNSVDDIRNLTDQVRIPPQVGKYKVYIIDEVHMLSTSAFNAFLKTLEEPPAHAIFILATTEKHKIIPTILSRCQIFDFKRIGIGDIVNHLAKVAKAEGIEAEEDALHIIAQKADGALRDALSTFDRVVSFSGKKLTREAVAENLNVLDYSWYFKITDAILENNIPESLLTLNKILERGFDGHHFIMGLASHFRDLLVCKKPETLALLQISDPVKEQYKEQSQKLSFPFLVQAIEIATTCDLNFKRSQNQRLLLELTLMQLASLSLKPEKKKSSENKPFLIPADQVKKTAKPEAKSSEPVSVPEKQENSQLREPASEENAYQKKPALEPDEKPASGQENQVRVKPDSPAVSAYSLTSIRRKQEIKKQQQANSPDPDSLPAREFSEEMLQEAWTAYAKKLEARGRFILASHLTMDRPVLKGTQIHLEYPNHTIKEEMNRARSKILKFLRKRLENYEIDLNITVNEEAEKEYIYSDREKFEKMKEINPAIEKLRQEFGLDL